MDVIDANGGPDVIGQEWHALLSMAVLNRVRKTLAVHNASKKRRGRTRARQSKWRGGEGGMMPRGTSDDTTYSTGKMTTYVHRREDVLAGIIADKTGEDLLKEG